LRYYLDENIALNIRGGAERAIENGCFEKFLKDLRL